MLQLIEPCPGIILPWDNEGMAHNTSGSYFAPLEPVTDAKVSDESLQDRKDKSR